MTANDINEEVLKTYMGRIMRKLDASAFRIVVVLGVAKTGDKLRVCVWSDNSRRWSNPQTRRVDQLDTIVLAKLTPGQRRACQHAAEHIEKAGNCVRHYRRGIAETSINQPYTVVGKPWITKAAPKPPAAGVTKLAPSTFTATKDGRSKLQKLNNTLSDWMFGGGRK